jgi:hypothetical protein
MTRRERSAMSLTTFFGLMGRLRAVAAAFVPLVDKVLGQVNIFVAVICFAAPRSAGATAIRALTRWSKYHGRAAGINVTPWSKRRSLFSTAI